MKKILVAFVITMFASAAYAAEGTPAQSTGSNNTDTAVVHKAKKTKKKGKKSKKAKAAAPADAGAPAAGGAPAGQ